MIEVIQYGIRMGADVDTDVTFGIDNRLTPELWGTVMALLDSCQVKFGGYHHGQSAIFSFIKHICHLSTNERALRELIMSINRENIDAKMIELQLRGLL